MVTKRLLPATRIHEPMLVDVEVEGGKVVDARCTGLMFRGIETMMKGRDPRDAIFFTQRICGICSSAHGIAAAYALEDAYGLSPTQNGQLIRNIIFGADIIQNHLRHFYVLVMPDYVQGPDISPFIPKPGGDFRLPEKENSRLMESYWQALEMSAKAHQLLALFGAKAPHQQTIYPTGVSVSADADRVNAGLALIDQITAFVKNRYLEDVKILARYYDDYYQIGRGYGNLLSFGIFPEILKGKRFFPAGIIENLGAKEHFNPEYITEAIRYSWYKDDQEVRRPVNGRTDPDLDKEGAYTWVKAPRYQGRPFEGGPLSRLWMKGVYDHGASVMDRIVARALETNLICREIPRWLKELNPGQPPLIPYKTKEQANGIGLTDAMRGPLGHWLKIEKGKLSHYQIVTPTAWNFSPRGSDNRRGPVEEALIGTPVEDPENLIEVGRVIRCFDPCFTCAVHLIRPNEPINKFIV